MFFKTARALRRQLDYERQLSKFSYEKNEELRNQNARLRQEWQIQIDFNKELLEYKQMLEDRLRDAMDKIDELDSDSRYLRDELRKYW